MAAYAGIFCATEAEIQAKEGAGVSASVTSDMHTFWEADAESFINNITRENWSDAFGTLNVDVKYILREAASNLAAIYGIQYDMSGYTSISEATTMLNVLWARAMECIRLLQDKKREDFIDGET